MNLLTQHQTQIHPSEIWREQSEWESIARAEYAGSFPVVGENQDERMECVRRMLLEMKNVSKSRPVLLAISLSGIKVCSHTGESILMAHALKRISYATCHPEFCQFSFLAREPKAHTNFQHCHVFMTRSPQEAEEVNSVVAGAFGVAYACQRQSQVIRHPTLNELIGYQMDLQKEGLRELSRRHDDTLAHRLLLSHAASAPFLEQRRQKCQRQRDEREKQICQVKERIAWAKKIVDNTSWSCLPPKDSFQGLLPVTVSTSIQDDTRLTQLSQHCTSAPLSRSGDGEVLLSHQSNSAIHGCADELVEEGYLCPVPCCSEIPKMDATGSELEFQICRHMVEEMSLSDEEEKEEEDAAVERSIRASSRLNGIEGGPETPGGASPPAAAAPEGRTNGRPLSGKYQNDEIGGKTTSRDSSREPDAKDIYQGPPTPIRHDSLRKMTSSQGTLLDELQESAWYQPGLPRETALEVLSQQDIGSFVIRDSTTHPGCFALSVKVPRYDNPSGISHYLITRTAKGSFKIKGLEKEWPTLGSLVTHHTVMRELLPCLLHIPRPSNATSCRDLDNDSCNY